jgi:hypothetical protein
MAASTTAAYVKKALANPEPSTHGPTLAPQQKHFLFDHLVGEQLHLVGDGQAKRFGRLEVDHQFELGRLHHRQVGRLGALEDAAGIDAGLAKYFNCLPPPWMCSSRKFLKLAVILQHAPTRFLPAKCAVLWKSTAMA